MRCPSCGHENPGDAHYCNRCASPMQELCIKCGQENVPHAKFCTECGTPISSPASATVSTEALPTQEDPWTDLQRVDPFGHPWLMKSLKGDSSRAKALVVIWGMCCLLPLVLLSIITLLDGSFYIEGPGIGLVEDISGMVTMFVYVPLLLSAAAIVFPRLSRVLGDLQHVIAKAPPWSTADDDHESVTGEGGARLSADCYNEILKQRADTILMRKGNKSRYLAAVLFSIGLLWVVSVSVGIAYTVDDVWPSTTYPMSFAALTLYMTLFYGLVTPFLVFKLMTILHAMRSVGFDLTKLKVIRVRPLNPDKAGGLGVIGSYSFQLVLVTLVPLIPIVTRIVLGTTTPITFVNASMYIPLLILTFFYPLGGAHRAMRIAKRETLSTLSDQFNSKYDAFMGNIRAKDLETLRSDFALAENLDKMYAKAQGMPVWPFNLATLGRFGGILGTVALTVWLKFILTQLAGLGL